jgi:Acyl-CoA carboxylase epsilon subunit
VSAREGADGDGRPVLRIVRGDATAEEIAALVALLGSRGRSAAPARSPTRSAWADPAAGIRRTARPGPGAWARSGREAGSRTRAGW